MTRRKHLALIGVFTLLAGLVVAPIGLSQEPVASEQLEPTPNPTIAAPTIGGVALRIEALEKRIDDLHALVEVQSGVFDATVARMESNQSQLLAIVGVASLLVAVLGLGVVRIWVRNSVEQGLSTVAREEFSRQVEKEIDALREEWEPKFTKLYKEYEKLGGEEHGDRR